MDFTDVDQSIFLMKIGLPIESANCYYAYKNGLYGYPQVRPINFSMVDVALSHPDAKIIPCWTVGRLIEIVIRASKNPLTITYRNTNDLMEFMLSIMKNCPYIQW